MKISPKIYYSESQKQLIINHSNKPDLVCTSPIPWDIAIRILSRFSEEISEAMEYKRQMEVISKKHDRIKEFEKKIEALNKEIRDSLDHQFYYSELDNK